MLLIWKDIVTVLSKMTPILLALFVGFVVPILIEGSRGGSLNLE